MQGSLPRQRHCGLHAPSRRAPAVARTPARRGVVARGAAAAGGGEAGAAEGDALVEAFRARLIAESDRCTRVASSLDFGEWFESQAHSDVRLRVVVREKGSPLNAGTSGSGGSGSGSSSSATATTGSSSGSSGSSSSGATSSAASAGAGAAAGRGGAHAAAQGDGAASKASGVGASAAAASNTAGDSRRVVAEIPGHALLLREAMGWAQGALESSDSELEVEVEDEDEAAAAKLLVQVVYSTADPSRPLRGADTATLLRVLRLAGRLQVPCGVKAASAALAAAAGPGQGGGGSLPWDAVAAAFALPTESPALAAAARGLRDAALGALQSELGDLDLAWLDAARREKLLALPYEGIRALLSDGRTRAVSEATVFFTADAWLHANNGGSRQMQAGLAACLRLPHIRLPYLCGVVAQSDWLTRHVSATEIHRAICWGLSQHRVAALAASAVETPPPGRPAWQLPRRPPSKVTKLKMEWDVALSALKKLHRAAVRDASGAAEIAAPVSWAYDGVSWTLELQAESGCGPGDGVTYGLFITPSGPPMHPPGCAAAALVGAKISLDARSTHRRLRGSARMEWLLGREGRGFEDMFEIGPQAQWDEAAWRDAGLVGEDGRVRVGASVREVS